MAFRFFGLFWSEDIIQITAIHEDGVVIDCALSADNKKMTTAYARYNKHIFSRKYFEML